MKKIYFLTLLLFLGHFVTTVDAKLPQITYNKANHQFTVDGKPLTSLATNDIVTALTEFGGANNFYTLALKTEYLKKLYQEKNYTEAGRLEQELNKDFSNTRFNDLVTQHPEELASIYNTLSGSEFLNLRNKMVDSFITYETHVEFEGSIVAPTLSYQLHKGDPNYYSRSVTFDASDPLQSGISSFLSNIEPQNLNNALKAINRAVAKAVGEAYHSSVSTGSNAGELRRLVEAAKAEGIKNVLEKTINDPKKFNEFTDSIQVNDMPNSPTKAIDNLLATVVGREIAILPDAQLTTLYNSAANKIKPFIADGLSLDLRTAVANSERANVIQEKLTQFTDRATKLLGENAIDKDIALNALKEVRDFLNSDINFTERYGTLSGFKKWLTRATIDKADIQRITAQLDEQVKNLEGNKNIDGSDLATLAEHVGETQAGAGTQTVSSSTETGGTGETTGTDLPSGAAGTEGGGEEGQPSSSEPGTPVESTGSGSAISWGLEAY